MLTSYHDDISDVDIPQGEEVLFTTPSNDIQALHIHTLAKAWVFSRKLENPYTREPLTEVDAQRVKNYKTVNMVLCCGNEISVPGVSPVWLAILFILRKACGSSMHCLQFDVCFDSVSMFSIDMHTEVSSLELDGKTVVIRPHTNYRNLRNLAAALAEQTESIYIEISRSIHTHLQGGSLVYR